LFRPLAGEGQAMPIYRLWFMTGKYLIYNNNTGEFFTYPVMQGDNAISSTVNKGAFDAVSSDWSAFLVFELPRVINGIG
jgi:hypothetical protein